MIEWHIGCSGFHYKHWKEIFYPKDVPQRLWFDYYCRHFNTIELNVTAYRFPRVPVLMQWYDKSPAGFSFSVKAPKAITHYKKLNDCERMINDFYSLVAEGLRDKVGCLLFQFPPNFHYSEEKLERIVTSLHDGHPNVVEFRHNSWWNEEVYKELKKHKISFAGMSHPHLPATFVANTSLLYYRMHGVPDLYKSLYSRREVKNVLKAVKESTGVKRAFIYFNNDIGGSAVKNAIEMNQMVANKEF